MTVRDTKYGLVIVDLQLCQVPGRSRDKDNIDAIVPSLIPLLHQSVSNQIPIIFLEYRADGWRDTLPELLDQLPDPERAVIIQKNSWCGFKGTEGYGQELIKRGNHTFTSLRSYLKQLNLTDLIISGWHVELCIRETINTAIRLGYDVHTSPEIIAPTYLARSSSNLIKIFDPEAEWKLHTYDTVDDLLEATSYDNQRISN